MATSLEAVTRLNGSCKNYLNIEDYYFNSGVGSWGVSNATLNADASFRLNNQYSTLKVMPLSSSPLESNVITIEHAEVSFPSTFGNDYMTFYGHIYCESKVTIEVTLTSSFGVSETVTTVLNALTWGVIRGPELQVPLTEGNVGFTTTISIKFHNGSAIYLGHPVLTNIYAIRNNLFLRMCMQRMPAFFIEKDSEQTFPNFPLMRIMDIGLAYAGSAVDQLNSFPYLDIASGYDSTNDATRSHLVDPQAADKKFLTWLAQLVGVKLSTTTGGSTPWGNLPTTWGTFKTLIDASGDSDTLAEWFEIEKYNNSDSNFIQGRRDQITTARSGLNAGTNQAIISSVQTVLSASKTVNILLDPIASPWVITIQTRDTETPSGASSDTSVLGAAELSRPMGYTYVHTVVSTYGSSAIYNKAGATYNDTLL